MQGQKGRIVWIVLAVVVVLAAAGAYFYFFQFAKAKNIRLGALFDLTGPTSDVGVDYSLGVKDAVRWINDHGGIYNKKIELIANDYGYKIPKARILYKKYINEYKVELIQGWGTGDTQALMPEVNKDSVVYMSASYSAALTDPFYTPYNFFIGTDYSTSIRLAIKYIKESHTDASRAPKMIFIYPDHPYGRAPIPAGKRMAAELGIEYGQDQLVALGAKTATEQLAAVKAYQPDWVWLGGTLNSCAVVIRDAGVVGLDTKFIVNTWGFDERLREKAGPYAIGRTYGVMPCSMWGDKVPGMRDIMAAYSKYRSAKKHTIHYVKGWLSMMVMAEAIKRARGDASGPAVRDAMETIRNFNLGNLSAPITYTDRDHRPNTKLKLYKIEAEKYVLVTEIGMPRDSRFIGW
jgi:branched-chain amino acid transport system substrate-binding protein